MVLWVFTGAKKDSLRTRGRAAPPDSTAVFFTAPQKFGVNFGQFRELPLQFKMRGNSGAGLDSLRGRFKKKFSDFARAQTLHEIKKRAVLKTTMAAAVGLATRQVLFDIRSAQ